MVAVGWAVLNRRNNPAFPNSVCEVVRQGGENPPCQFSLLVRPLEQENQVKSCLSRASSEPSDFKSASASDFT